MRPLASFLFYKLLGWKMNGKFPEVDQCVIAVAPHTSWVDFPLGLLVRSVVGKPMHYVGKKSLFRWPYGWFFRWTGGAPVDRSRASDTVGAVAALFEEHREFRLALAPEGTRKKVEQWRTGFYYIALRAKVPIVLVAFDFGKKEVKVSEPLHPSGDFESDYASYRRFFEGVKGFIPAYS